MLFFFVSRCSITSFEELPNELIDKIFEYLNGYDIYQGFFHSQYTISKFSVERKSFRENNL